MSVIKMTDIDLSGKRVLIREDLNVPVADGVVTSDARIQAALPTIKAALAANAAVMLVSHLGRPKEGQPEEQFSLRPVADHLSKLLGREVALLMAGSMVSMLGLALSYFLRTSAFSLAKKPVTNHWRARWPHFAMSL